MAHPQRRGAPQPNRLARELSPYLLQHAHNPVDWHPWGDDAFREAAARDRPVLLSIGYAACHWCHVMERESFEDAAVADYMNREFVCIKVDREERPDVDRVYMEALQAMGGAGGWPLNLFLTPALTPFYGGTYWPPVEGYGRPSFQRVLEAVAEAWRSDRPGLERHGRALAEHIAGSLGAVQPSRAAGPDVIEAAVTRLRTAFVPDVAGFGGAPRFPQPMVLDFLLRCGAPGAAEMALATLRAMAAGGIHDQVGGGFHRYTVDERWLVPHFEKMLYDNALLADAYLTAWQVNGEALYQAVVERTLDFVRAEMMEPEGGFWASIDADSDGEEGLFYTWTPSEVAQALGRGAGAFCARYGVTARGHVEGRSVPHLRAGRDGPATADDLGKLHVERSRRGRPATDTKLIAGWNGLMLGAFARAGAALGRADYLQAAVNAAEALLGDHVYREPNADGLLRLRRCGRTLDAVDPVHPTTRLRRFVASDAAGQLEDYAAVAVGFLRLFEATGDVAWFTAARNLVDAARERFGDKERGGYFDTPDDAPSLIVRPRELADSAVPSGGALMAEALLELHALTGEPVYRAEADAAMCQAVALAEGAPLAAGRWLGAMLRTVRPPAYVVVAAVEGDPDAPALLRAARRAGGPNAWCCSVSAGAPDPRAPAVLRGKAPVGGRATAYVCRSGACSPPLGGTVALSDWWARDGSAA
ncbi:MAG: thioredoxin domain-containing protein [Armatimonadetes bacterium]|nr:thioredoxin domain-containing protein [Armatimonadota bacterium]